MITLEVKKESEHLVFDDKTKIIYQDRNLVAKTIHVRCLKFILEEDVFMQADTINIASERKLICDGKLHGISELVIEAPSYSIYESVDGSSDLRWAESNYESHCSEDDGFKQQKILVWLSQYQEIEKDMKRLMDRPASTLVNKHRSTPWYTWEEDYSGGNHSCVLTHNIWKLWQGIFLTDSHVDPKAKEHFGIKQWRTIYQHFQDLLDVNELEEDAESEDGEQSKMADPQE